MIPLPKEFIAEIETMLGNDAPAFFASMEAPASLALRINPRRAAAADAARPYIDHPVP